MSLSVIIFAVLVGAVNARGSSNEVVYDQYADSDSAELGGSEAVLPSTISEIEAGDNSYVIEGSYVAEDEQYTEQRQPAAKNPMEQKEQSGSQLQQQTQQQSQQQNSSKGDQGQHIIGDNPAVPAYVQYYQKRYPLTSTSMKLVDNRGNGFIDLYGVRNFRTVLNGILYRGGANNAFNKNKMRNNRNPLPEEGLSNLCKEGFRNVIYLYTTNYDKKSNPVNCKTERGPDEKLEIKMSYLQKGPWDRKTQYAILKIVYDNIINPEGGPVYMHCWNGWHASGLISSFALRQFCNYSGAQAAKYWDINTDGNNKGKAYDSYRSQIKSFIQFEDLKLPVETMNQICLAPPSL